MIKKWSELNDREKEIIHKGIFYVLIFLVLVSGFKAYKVYDEYGFESCIVETNTLTKEDFTLCFNNTKERNEYLQAKTYPNNLDYKYINKYNNISNVE